ncbi:MAG: DUF1801 domain-containing protein [Bacteroidetes bacterium]|nr:DUF1801 domain-containing protein [Bacteroidota bacterium]
MAEIKTRETTASVEDFINSVPDEQKRKDSFVILEMMKKLLIGFSPRKANLSLYLTMNIKEHADVLKKLGKHKTGVGCLYINKLEDIDIKVLKGIIAIALKRK